MTPEQMRALADRGAVAVVEDIATARELVDALRAAADQLEAVQRIADQARTEWGVLPNGTLASMLDAILTADTAPHADDCRYWGGYPQRACTCKQKPEGGNE